MKINGYNVDYRKRVFVFDCESQETFVCCRFDQDISFEMMPIFNKVQRK